MIPVFCFLVFLVFFIMLSFPGRPRLNGFSSFKGGYSYDGNEGDMTYPFEDDFTEEDMGYPIEYDFAEEDMRYSDVDNYTEDEE